MNTATTKRWMTMAGTVCLVAGPVGQLVQYVVTPVSEADSASGQVAAAAHHLTRIQWSMALDLFILLIAPAVLFAGRLAASRMARIAALGTGLVFTVWLTAGYLLGTDILLYVAAREADRTVAVHVVDGYLSNPVISGVVVAYLAGHVIGFVLLGVALARSRAVPVWAGVAVAVWPLGELAGGAAGVKVIGVAGFALLALGFGACAVSLAGAGWDEPAGSSHSNPDETADAVG